ncbi:DUF4157 domain-containing protein [Microbacterium sp. BK668]|uniref:eCIS core domain-containing protein n=1 Tax=Microbacterium sp. BK668 TaxID=2512118 RepID=UPI0010E0A26D|nr:DUF4157 domain-containing protein [Microbacterium sp. BK668]TDN93076.1 uncharacterized protein DUF4157 [Microbacterium sp. BK668]
MSTFDFDTIDGAVRRTREERRSDTVSPVGLREHRLDVLGPAGMLRLQREAGNSAVAGLAEEERSPVLDVVSSGGSGLDRDVRSDMEGRLGADFSDVRVHTDAAAHDSARAVGAHAYTVGSHVVFQRDAYDPHSTAGRTTLAHELTHVMQQRSGPVDGTPTGGGVSVSDPGDRFERAAAANAERVMSTDDVAEPVQRSADGSAPVVQRAEDPDEEPDESAAVQGLFVQREEAPEEEEEAG